MMQTNKKFLIEDMQKETPGLNEYYLKVQSDLEVNCEAFKLIPYIYQPTPKGLEFLAQTYGEKYGVNIQVWDTSDRVQYGDVMLRLFEDFYKNGSKIYKNLQEGEKVGIVLCNKQNHVIPFFLSNEKNKKYMVILDSTASERMKGYWNKIARWFPNYEIRVNTGARQADSCSCITESVCILKDALKQDNLGANIDNKYLTQLDMTHIAGSKLRRSAPVTPPANFQVFKLPEVLLKTAQSSSFVKRCNPNFNIIVDEENHLTLKEHRSQNKLYVNLMKKNIDKDTNIYLIKQSIEHRHLIDEHLNKSNNLLGSQSMFSKKEKQSEYSNHDQSVRSGVPILNKIDGIIDLCNKGLSNN